MCVRTYKSQKLSYSMSICGHLGGGHSVFCSYNKNPPCFSTKKKNPPLSVCLWLEKLRIGARLL